MNAPARYYRRLPDGRLECVLCPRRCKLREGQHGACLVRANLGGKMVLTTYGRSSGFCIDPIEKKPLNHFYPGTAVLSFGTAGCNLACKYCQNWSISAAKELDATLDDAGTPEAIVAAALAYGAQGLAFTYNDPIIFAEYAIDCAELARKHQLYTVAVTNGYIEPGAREEFFGAMDAANVDLKGFTEEFYFRYCGGKLQPVLDTLRYLVHQTDVWVEITTLLIPGLNDSESEIRALSRWVRDELKTTVPLHFTAFFPAFKMLDRPPTPPQTLVRARAIAREEGLAYVYTGNVRDREGATTYCPDCGTPLIKRDGYLITRYALTPEGHCPACGREIEGRFAAAPGHFGNRRIPIVLGAG